MVDNGYSGEAYSLRYYLLEEDKADYVGMAQTYREYLISQGMEKKEAASEASLYLTLYGGIEDTEYFLGVPYKSVEKLTSYEETRQILSELKAGGVDKLTVRYSGWQKDGLEASIPTKVRFVRCPGGHPGIPGGGFFELL